MKQLIYILLLGVVFSSCKKEKSTDIQPVDLKVNVAYPTTVETSGYTLPIENVVVKIKNVNTGNVLTLNTNDKGSVIFSGIAAGTYDIDASISINATKYTEITAIPTATNVVFNASSKNKLIAVGFNGSVDLSLVAGTIGDWVIKQVYYAGSHRTNGATYRDQFIEFYNNSDKVLYADSLYFAELTGLVSLTNNSYYRLPNNQMDWSQSVGMPANIDANNDYIYARALLMIPGTGKQYPVQPGKSIVVAQTAINHKSPFTGVDGKVITVVDPSLTVDLSGADFEAYYAEVASRPLPSDVNTSVPNLEILSFFGTDMIFDTDGRYSYALIKADSKIKVKELPQYNYPTKTPPSSGATKYYQIPNSIVIDAVEIQPNLPADRIPKKLNPILDAGFTFVPAGNYTSQSVIRKTEKTINGRIVLKDTNNSTEDFDYFNIATPRGFK